MYVSMFENIHPYVLSGVPATAREEEAAGGPLVSAAGQRNTGKEVC